MSSSAEKWCEPEHDEQRIEELRDGFLICFMESNGFEMLPRGAESARVVYFLMRS